MGREGVNIIMLLVCGGCLLEMMVVALRGYKGHFYAPLQNWLFWECLCGS